MTNPTSILREWIDVVNKQIFEDTGTEFKKGDTVVVVSNTDAKGKTGKVTAVGTKDGLVADEYATVMLDGGPHISVSIAQIMRPEDYEKIPAGKAGLGSYEVTMTFKKNGESPVTKVVLDDIPFQGAVLYPGSVKRIAKDSEVYKQMKADGWTLTDVVGRTIHR
jgi:ribosomal protein L24